MTLLTRKKQLAAREEDVVGTSPSGFPANTDADTLPEELAVSPEVDAFTREFVRDAATALKKTIGKKTGGVSFKADMKGTTLGTHAAGAPNFSKYLKGCGFEEVEVQFILIGAVTGGPFRHGETITQTVTGETRTVFIDTHNDATQLNVESKAAGTVDAVNIWTGQDTGATATPTTVPADEGFGWRLNTVTQKEFDLTGAWSTAPTAGDVLEGATSGARCIYLSDNTVTQIFYREIRGTFTDGETLDNVTSGVASMGTLATPTREEYTYNDPLALTVWEDGVAVVINGARGNVAFEFEVNRPTKMLFELRGVLTSASDLANLTGINYDYTTPPLWAGAVTGFADNESTAGSDEDESAEQDVCMRTLNLDLGAQLADRECAGAAGGLKEVFIPDREGTFSMDPEATREDDIAWLGLLQAGTVARLRVPVGTADGNRFTFFMPGLQLDAASAGDRDKIMTRDVTGGLTGGNLHNLVASPTLLSSIGGDNEIAILYHTS